MSSHNLIKWKRKITQKTIPVNQENNLNKSHYHHQLQNNKSNHNQKENPDPFLDNLDQLILFTFL